MILSQTTASIEPLLQWLNLATLVTGFVLIAVQIGRKSRDIEQTAEQLDRLRIIVEELSRAFALQSQSNARDFGRIEAEMHALARRVEMLENSEIVERNHNGGMHQ